MYIIVIDTLCSFFFCFFLSLLLVRNSTIVWILCVVSVVGFIITLSSMKSEKGFTSWFILIKTITSLIGVISMNLFRQKEWYTKNTHYITLFFLHINIMEAIGRELQLGYYTNSVVAIILLCSMPYTLTSSTYVLLQNNTHNYQCFVFPLSSSWILLYTSWNACFSYSDNMSWQTRLILIPPLIISLYDIHLWLSARVLLLLLHLFLRATQLIWFYQPGVSFLTPAIGSIHNSSTLAHFWGMTNICLFILYSFFSRK
jgi:hypothetical protein